MGISTNYEAPHGGLSILLLPFMILKKPRRKLWGQWKPFPLSSSQHSPFHINLYSLNMSVIYYYRIQVLGRPQAVSEKKALQKMYQTLNEWKIHPNVSVLKLSLLDDLQQKVGELVLSITSFLWIIILENTLNWCTEKCGYGNLNHSYHVSHIPFHSVLGVRNFTKVVRVCANRLWRGPLLPTV
jgi:hypothetical protein